MLIKLLGWFPQSSRLIAGARRGPVALTAILFQNFSFLASDIFMACLIDAYFVLEKPQFDARLSHRTVLPQELLDLYS